MKSILRTKIQKTPNELFSHAGLEGNQNNSAGIRLGLHHKNGLNTVRPTAPVSAIS